jgi:hypothetical protein
VKGVLFLFRGLVSHDQSGIGISKPGELTKNDNEFDIYRKRMMLAYRFRPNPLVYDNYYNNNKQIKLKITL